MDRNNMPRIGVLSCLTSVDEETNLHLAHCLNFDLMECGKTQDEAWLNLKTSLKHYIEHCYTNFTEGLTESASREEWEQYVALLRQGGGKPARVDEIHLELKSPMPDCSAPVWLQGVQNDGSTCNYIQ